MNRYCFLLQVRPALLEQYREEHRHVWPDMLRALADAGWHNYSLFVRPDGLLVGYVESEDLAAAQEAMAATAVNARWQESMGRYFTGLDGRGPDEGLQLLDEVFHLEDQLAGLADPPASAPPTDHHEPDHHEPDHHEPDHHEPDRHEPGRTR